MAKHKNSIEHSSADRLGKQTLILDNGAHSIKTGFSVPGTPPTLSSCHAVANCIARSQRDKITYVGADLDHCADFGELLIRRPVEKGFIVNWEAEKCIWEKTLLDPSSRFHCDPRGTTVVLTEAPHAPAALQRNADEMVFEEFEFASLWRTGAAGLNAFAFAGSPFARGGAAAAAEGGGLGYGVPVECLMVVDAGHSHTTVTPLYHGRVLQGACRRLEIGGKTLTNYLKGLLHVTMDIHREEWITQEIKEDTCYVAADKADFNDRLERIWKGGQKDRREIDTSIVVDYVMPDYERIKRGFVRPYDPTAGLHRFGTEGDATSEIVLPIGNERFRVPEILFTPSDIGMQQEGIAGTVLQSLNALPKGLHQAFLANVLVVGGTSKLPGFVERLEADLRSRVDSDLVVRVARAEDPVKNAWLGGARLAQNEELLKSLVVTRAEYMEHGDVWTRRKFAGKVGR